MSVLRALNLAKSYKSRQVLRDLSLEVESGEVRRLTFNDSTNSAPAISPDGSSVAFMSTRTEKPQLWLLPLDGGEPRKLTDLAQGLGGVVDRVYVRTSGGGGSAFVVLRVPTDKVTLAVSRLGAVRHAVNEFRNATSTVVSSGFTSLRKLTKRVSWMRTGPS